MKNKFIKIKLTSGDEVVMKKSRISYVVFNSRSGTREIGCIATKTKCIDGNLIVNRDEVLEDLKDWRMK